MTNEEETPRINSGPVLVGLILTFVGLAMLADRTGISGGLHLAGKFWPFVMIAFGVTRVIAPPEPRMGHPPSKWTGIWFIYLGLWFFINEFHVFVGTGLGMIWRAIEASDRRSGQRTEGGQ
jgi:LiaF transmembrane domain